MAYIAESGNSIPENNRKHHKNMGDHFLSSLLKAKKEIYTYLVNGIKLGGFIEYFDDKIIMLKSLNSKQLIHRSAIATICCDSSNNDEWKK